MIISIYLWGIVGTITLFCGALKLRNARVAGLQMTTGPLMAFAARLSIAARLSLLYCGTTLVKRGRYISAVG